MPRRCLEVALVFVAAATCAAQDSQPGEATPVRSAEQRAVAYLAREVSRWSRENGCFSCHNNGDAARALYTARKLSYEFPPEALEDTTSWLLRPLEWDDNKGEAGFSDKKLARIQFAAALSQAVATGFVRGRRPMVTAGEILVRDQEAGGFWLIDPSASIGSPATYGRVLATYMAREVLQAAGESRFADSIAKADRWLRARKPATTMAAATLVLALAGRSSPAQAKPAAAGAGGEATLQMALDAIQRGQSSDGGWGPYAKSPSEPFDTSLVLLALASLDDLGLLDSATRRRLIAQGRAYLTETQLAEGGWPETTRPSGSQSYAQHISTTGWATLALLKTRGF